MKKIPNYTFLYQISESRIQSLYNGQRDSDHSPIFIKILKIPSPTPSQIARIKVAYSRIRQSEIDGITKTYDVITEKDSIILIEEAIDAITLRAASKGKWSIKSFLPIAIQISQILGRLHKKSIPHLGLTPDNLLIFPQTGDIKITNLGLSSILRNDSPDVYDSHVVHEILSYISPEQTGRINRDVDYRSDIYSLGIVFYEMLIGNAPFKTNDALKMIHSHIAEQARPLSEVDPSIPPTLSAIILRMIRKTPEERYQNCFGLAADLIRCQDLLTDENTIDFFPLGTQDLSLKFNIPQIFIGREKELACLRSSFERVTNGASELIVVSGNPGVGKSALVHEVHKPVVAQKGFFICGKYDQLGKDIPYSSIIQAFKHLIQLILTENETARMNWKNLILNALGPNKRMITDLIPNIKELIGEPHELEMIRPDESLNPFSHVFQNFVNVFAQKQHPLVLFLDDMQWADNASIKLLESLITNSETHHLLVITAYRDKEVPSSHPFAISIDTIRKMEIAIHDIHIEPLSIKDINYLITHVLKCNENESFPLTKEVYSKTGGNPFFFNQFAKSLYEDGYLQFCDTFKWTWDVKQLQQIHICNDVVDLMISRISRLEVNAQNILLVCASIGNQFDLETIAMISGRTLEKVLNDLAIPIQEQLIGFDGSIYRFHHDRIQEAAYALIPIAKRTQMHYIIAKNLLDKMDENDIYDHIFYVVGQLNHAKELIQSPKDIERLIKLNLIAGQKAIRCTAYASAVTYLNTAISMLPPDSWNSDYATSYATYKNKLEAEYLNLNFKSAISTFEIIVQHVKNNIDLINTYSTMVILYTTKGNYEEATRLGLEGMNLVGIKTPPTINNAIIYLEIIKCALKLGRRKIEDLDQLDTIKNPEILAFRYLTTHTSTVAYYRDANLFSFLVLRGLFYILKYGNFEYSPNSFIAAGAIIGSLLNLYKIGFRFGQTAMRLSRKMGSTRARSRIEYLFAMALVHTRMHAEHSLDYFRSSYLYGLESSDLMFCHHSINMLVMYRLMLGDPLDDVIEEYKKYELFQKDSKDPFVVQIFRQNLQYCLCLKGLTPKPYSLDDDNFDTRYQLTICDKVDNVLAKLYILSNLQRLTFIFGKYDECLQMSNDLYQLVEQKIAYGSLHVPEFFFYYSLALTMCRNPTSILSDANKRQLKINQKKMKTWSRHCPENFLHKYLLIKAQIARIRNRPHEAARLYNEAIVSARQNRYTQNEAIANELAADFWQNRNNTAKANFHLKNAYSNYCRWQASAKIAELEEKYPMLPQMVTHEEFTLRNIQANHVAG